MTLNPLNLTAAMAGVLTLTLAACGGGSSTSSTPSTTPITISGTAATGAAFTDALVYVYDSTGAVVGTSSAIGADGQYSVTLSANAVAPFVLVASRTTADGLTESLVSVVSSTTQTTANVTPITSLIASRLSPSGDPSKLASELAAGSVQVTPDAVTTVVNEVNTILAPLLTATGTTGSDPLTAAITTDGTGYDRLLDSLNISIVPTSSSTSNIDITVKTALADAAEPTAISFTSATTSPTALPAISANDLVASGTSARIQDLLTRLNTCFAEPLSTRVSGQTISSTTCNGLFLNDTPSLFKHNSYTVGSGAFNGIFTADTAANVKFDRPRYEFTVNNGNTNDATKPMNGDVVFTASWTDANGNSDASEYWARPTGTGKLQLTGNLSGIDAEVSARAERREFLHANTSQYSYLNVGYNIYVNDKHSFAKIVVTTPKGNKLTLTKPNSLGFYELMKPTSPSPTSSQTSVLRLAGGYINTASSGSPRAIDPGFWAKTNCTTPADASTCEDVDWSDAQIAALPAQGNWTFDLYTNAGDANPVNTIRRRTTNRPLTISEARQAKWPSLVDEVTTFLRTNSTPGYFAFLSDGTASVNSGTDGTGPGWTVPDGAWSPTSFKIYGKDTSNASKKFVDKAVFRSNTRRTEVTCADEDGIGVNDQHCVGTQFKTGVSLFQVQLNGRDQNRLQYSVTYRTQSTM